MKLSKTPLILKFTIRYSIFILKKVDKWVSPCCTVDVEWVTKMDVLLLNLSVLKTILSENYLSAHFIKSI